MKSYIRVLDSFGTYSYSEVTDGLRFFFDLSAAM